jgi:PAS domain S-box-containing protein
LKLDEQSPERDRVLARLADHAPTAIFIVRMDPENLLWPPIVYANDSFYRLTGYTREEHLAGIYPKVLGPETDIDLVLRSIASVRNGGNVRVEVKLYRRDGSWFWAEVNTIGDPPEYCLIEMYDITQRRGQEDRLTLLSEVVENAGEFITVVDSTPIEHGGPRIVYVNQALCRATGRDEHELIAQRYDVTFSPKNDPKVLEAIQSTIRSGTPNYREVLLRRKDGTDFWIEFVDHQFVSHHGEVMRLSIGRDITLRKRAYNQVSLLLAALERSQERVTLYETAENGELCVSFENERAVESPRKRLPELLSDHGSVGREIRHSLEAGKEASYVFADRDEAGGVSVVHFSAQAIQNGERTEAILTRERLLTPRALATAEKQSPLMKLVLMLPAMAEATTDIDRMNVFRTLLSEHFRAEVHTSERETVFGVHVDTKNQRIVFPFGRWTVTVTWPRPVEATEMTAMRFCVETLSELDRLST